MSKLDAYWDALVDVAGAMRWYAGLSTAYSSTVSYYGIHAGKVQRVKFKL